MRKVIHHLRQKPEQERRDLLHLFTIIFAIILLLIWIYSLGQSLSNPENKKKLGDDLKPLSTLKDNLSGSYQNILSPDSGTEGNTQQ